MLDEDKHPQTRAIKRQYTGEFFVIELRLLLLLPSKQPLNFIPIFFDSIFVVCSVRNGNVLFARGDSTVP